MAVIIQIHFQKQTYVRVGVEDERGSENVEFVKFHKHWIANPILNPSVLQ